MRTIKASELKARCLKTMDEVAATGDPVVITKNGVPITRLVPARHAAGSLFGALKGSVAVAGDIVGSVDAPWEAVG